MHNSFMHSLLAKGRLLYTHDETIADLCARLQRDRRARHADAAAARRQRTRCRPIDKAHKWFVTRGDLDYTALWILYAADAAGADRGDRRAACSPIARCIPQAMTLNPAFFKTIYTDLLNAKKTREGRAGRARRRRRATWRERAARCSRP